MDLVSNKFKTLAVEEYMEITLIIIRGDYDSIAVVFQNVIYNIGGKASTHSMMWCLLGINAPPDWKFMNLQT